MDKNPIFARRDDMKRLKESVSGSKTGLPPKLLDLFDAREPIPVASELRKKKPAVPYNGIAQFVSDFAAPGDEEYEPAPPVNRPPSPRQFRNREFGTQARIDAETKIEKKLRLQTWRAEEAKRIAEEGLRSWDTNKDSNVESDPYKTLFVGRLSYEVTEKKLKRDFEEFGPIKRIRLVHDKNTGKPRGYAFIEFEHKKDMKDAYKSTDGRKIEGRRVVVDVERGRTVENWKPRRFGGGLGGEGREAREPKKKGEKPAPATAAETRRDRDSRPADRRDEPVRGDRERVDRERVGSPDRRDRGRVDRERVDRERARSPDRREREKRVREPSPRSMRDEPKRRHVDEMDGRDRRRRERDLL